MKILWVSHFVPYPPRGGNLQRSYNLLRRLASRHEVHLLAFNRRASLTPRAADQDAARRALGEFCASVEVLPIEAERNPIRFATLIATNLGKTTPITTDMLESRRMARAVVRTASIVDLVHLDTIDLAPYADLVNGLPIVLHHHNVESILLARRVQHEKNPVTKAYLALQTMRIARMEAAECGRHALNVVVSGVDAKSLDSLSAGARIAVVPNGVDLDYYRPGPTPSSEDRVVWAGSMSWYPNREAIATFCRTTWPKIRALRPGVAFDLIGHSPPATIGGAGIRAHGFVDDIRPLVAQASAYVVPIRIAGGTRLKILDAMAMGKAIVSTSVGCEGLEVTPGEDILIADDPDEFARQTVRILEDKDLRERLGAEARRTVERLYGWDRVWVLLEAAYKGLVNSNGRPGSHAQS